MQSSDPPQLWGFVPTVYLPVVYWIPQTLILNMISYCLSEFKITARPKFKRLNLKPRQRQDIYVPQHGNIHGKMKVKHQRLFVLNSARIGKLLIKPILKLYCLPFCMFPRSSFKSANIGIRTCNTIY